MIDVEDFRRDTAGFSPILSNFIGSDDNNAATVCKTQKQF